MPNWIWKTLIYLFYSLLAVGLGFGIYFLKAHYEWSLWFAIFLYCAIVGIILGLIFGRKYFFRRKEKAFIKRIINEDGRRIDSIKTDSSIAVSELEKQWLMAINKLKTSSLKKLGNPLYVLPWYMVIGESGSGKTTMIEGSKLNSPLSANASLHGIGGTKNCEWWFFNEAVIIDTAGRYSIEVNKTLDDDEWEKFLQLLSKYRTKEPINGLVITISVDTLQTEPELLIYEKAQRIRRKVDQIMRALGENFPIYVMVTKMDLLYGFLSFFSSLDNEHKKHAMGFVNEDFGKDCEKSFDTGFESVLAKIKTQRFKFVHNSKIDANTIAESLIFASEFDNIRINLKKFILGMFEPNTYQETPMFRGIYFSASKAEQTIKSAFSNKGYMEQTIDQSKAVFSPLFVSEFFAKIMPSDRYSYHPILEYIKWQKVTLSGLAISWAFLCVSINGYMYYSYSENMKILEYTKQINTIRANLSDDLALNIKFLTDMNRVLKTSNDLTSSYANRLFGKSYSDEGVIYCKNLFASSFQTYFLNKLELRVTELVNSGVVQKNEKFTSDLAQFLVYDIYMIENRDNEEKIKKLKADVNFNLVASSISDQLFRSVNQVTAATVGEMFSGFVLMDANQKDLDKHKLIAVKNLVELLKSNNGDMMWLTSLAITNTENIDLNKHWPNLSPEYNNIEVNGAYTAEGRASIKNFLRIYKDSSGNNGWFIEKERQFWSWYDNQFFAQWYKFLSFNSTAYKDIESYSDTQAQTAIIAIAKTNPMIEVLRVAAEEFKKYRDENKTLPNWADDVILTADIINYTPKVDVNQSTTKMIIQDVQSFSKTVAKKELDAIQTYQDNTALSKQAFDKYFTSLKALSQVGVSPSASFSMAANFFKDRAEFQASKAEFYIAYSDYLAFIKTLEAFRKPSQFIKDYILESFRFYVYYSVNESSCFLNKKWEEDVVGGARGLSQSETPNVLFNKENGLVWNFVKNYADPFLIKGANGYKPKDALSQSIEFDNAFLEFLNKGALGSLTYQDAYAVKIKAMPISSNTNSKVKPYGSVLELTCLSKPQQLVNYNYPSEDTFNWTSDCSDVNIKILVNDVELIKTYRGKNGFAKFIEDFKGGTKIFKSADFPGNEAVFTSNAIQNISVSYAISGSDKMIKYYQQTPREIPASISQCWTK